MAKANKKAKVKDIKNDIKKGFSDYEAVFDMLVEQAEEMNMNLLVESIQLSKSILKTYKRAWIYRIKEDGK